LRSFPEYSKSWGCKSITFFTGHQGIKDIRDSSAAAFKYYNFSLAPEKLRGRIQGALRHSISQVAGTAMAPVIRLPLFFAVAKALGIEERAETIIKNEKDYVYSYLETAIRALSGSNFGVIGDANTVWVTRYLANDYSFTPILSIITDPVFRPDDGHGSKNN